MRWMIAAIAFLVPVFLAIHLATMGLGEGPTPAIGPEALAELRAWAVEKHDILQHYAPRKGDPESSSMPHLALERFERSGCDGAGNPWFRLAEHPPGVECGVLRHVAAGAVAPAGHRGAILMLRLQGDWLYWEWRQPAVEPVPQGRRSAP